MSLPADYFDDLYAGADDPWGFTSRWYEQRKYALTLAALPEPTYRYGLEIGCSIGVLTAQLATRCTSLLATDLSATALAAAALRVPEQVELRQLAVPREWPTGAGPFDLVVLSEVAYYLSPTDLTTLLEQIERATTPTATLVACHWRHLVPDYPLTGDQVHDVLRGRAGWSDVARHVEEDFLLDVLVRGEAVSVARRTGLV